MSAETLTTFYIDFRVFFIIEMTHLSKTFKSPRSSLFLPHLGLKIDVPALNTSLVTSTQPLCVTGSEQVGHDRVLCREDVHEDHGNRSARSRFV